MVEESNEPRAHEGRSAQSHGELEAALTGERERSRLLEVALAEARRGPAADDTAHAMVLDDLERERQAMSAELKSLRERLTTESTAAQATERARAGLERRVVALEEDLGRATAQLAAAEESLRNERRRLVGPEALEVPGLESRAAPDGESGAQSRVRALEAEVAELERARQAAVTAQEQAVERMGALEAELARGATGFEAARQELARAEAALLALRVQHGEMQHELATALAAAETSTRRVATLEEQLTEMTGENELNEVERSRLAVRIDELEHQVAEIPELKARLAAAPRPEAARPAVSSADLDELDLMDEVTEFPTTPLELLRRAGLSAPTGLPPARLPFPAKPGAARPGASPPLRADEFSIEEAAGTPAGGKK